MRMKDGRGPKNQLTLIINSKKRNKMRKKNSKDPNKKLKVIGRKMVKTTTKNINRLKRNVKGGRKGKLERN